MKKSMLVLTAALMFGGMATAQTAATASAPQVPALTDVPAGHWAKDAIDKLVSRGIILGYPDGTFRGTQNLTRYEAAVIIARLLDQMGSGQGPSLDADTITSLQNAVQELAADLAALGVRVSDLEENAVTKDDFSRLEARVEELAAAGGSGSGEAVAGIQTQIDDLTARVDEVAGNYDTLRADVDDNASSIAALNDLTVLLNQDILDLQDRVSAVEAAQADFVLRSDFDNLSTKVTGIDTRLTAIEKAPKFSVTGSVDYTYGRIAITQGVHTENGVVTGTQNNPFDITRTTYGTWAAGIFDVADSADLTSTDELKGGMRRYTGSGVRFGVKASQLTTANGLIVVNNAAINFWTISPCDIGGTGVSTTDCTLPFIFVNDASVDGTINGDKFSAIYNRRYADFKFQNYLFNNSDAAGTRRGVVVNIETNKLPFGTKVTLVAGSTNDTEMGGTVLPADYWGFHIEKGLNDGGKFAVNYGQVDNNRSALGYDADVKFGAFSVRSEGVLSVPHQQATFATNGGNLFNNLRTMSDGMIYVEGRADLGMFKFGANYRAINPEFFDGDHNAQMSSNYEAPYDPNQIGFGAALATNVGMLTVGAYVDRYTNWYGDPATATLGFGAKAGAKFGALEAVVFANRLTLDGDLIDGVKPTTIDNTWLSGVGADYNINAVGTGMGITKVPFEMTSTFGVEVSHDGAASNALVKNLNFTVGDAYYYASKTNSLYAFGDYNGSFGGWSVKPLFRFHNVSNGSIKDDLHNVTVLKGGVKISTPTLTGVPLAPSLYGNVVARSTKGNITGMNSSEVLAQTGITFNNIYANSLKASVGYAYYAGKNVKPLEKAIDSTDPFSAAYDRVYSSAISPVGTTAAGAPIFEYSGVKLTGLYAQVGWNGLTANWGLFKTQYGTTNSSTGATTATSTTAQAFKVNYSFKF